MTALHHTTWNILLLSPIILIMAGIGAILVMHQASLIPPTIYILVIFALPLCMRFLIQAQLSPKIKILVATICALVAIYGFELTLRLTNPSRFLPPNGVVDGDTFTWGHPVTYNTLGFRDEEIALDHEDTYRIMVLGDSITWGAGVSSEERYTNILENMLNQAQTDVAYDVINMAEEGGRTTAERDIARKYIDTINPHRIIIGFNENDPEEDIAHDTTAQETIEQYFVTPLTMLRRAGLEEIATATQKAAIRIGEKAGVLPPTQVTIRQPYDQNDLEWKNFIQSLQDIKSMSDSADLPPPILAILNSGIYTNKPTDYANPDEATQALIDRYNQARSAGEKLGYVVVDYQEEIRGEFSNRILSVNKLDAHPSTELHKLYARKLKDVILTESIEKK